MDGGTFEIRQKAAPIVPTADLYPLTIKNAAVFIEHDGEEIHAERNEIGDLVAKVPENASVTVTSARAMPLRSINGWSAVWTIRPMSNKIHCAFKCPQVKRV